MVIGGNNCPQELNIQMDTGSLARQVRKRVSVCLPKSGQPQLSVMEAGPWDLDYKYFLSKFTHVGEAAENYNSCLEYLETGHG